VSAALKGKRVILTRAVEQSEEWIRALESHGAEVLMLPAIRIVQPETWSLLDRELLRLHEFDWVLFTSRNAVRFVAERLGELDCALCCGGTSSPRVAAVGEATAEAVRQRGWQVDCVPQKQDGESLARELHDSLAGRRVLLPRSDRADDRLAIALEKSGAKVREVVAYLTLAPQSFDGPVADRLRRGDVDWAVFASPSAFHNLSHGLGEKEIVALSSRVHFLAIGPTTAKAMRAAGARIELEASAPDAEGVSRALCEYYEPPAAAAHSASTTTRSS
jgi:uroporphyrinogen III methyltransferase/synthase